MARSFIAKIFRHVTIRRSDGRIRSGTITAVNSNTNLDLRVGHSGEVYDDLEKGDNRAAGPLWWNTLSVFTVPSGGSLYPSETLYPGETLYPLA